MINFGLVDRFINERGSDVEFDKVIAFRCRQVFCCDELN